MSLDARKLTEGYVKRSEELSKTLSDLEKELKPILKKIEERNRLSATCEQLENEIMEGTARIGALKAVFFQAHFDEDFDQISQIGDRREELKAEIEGKTSSLESTKQELTNLTIPSQDIATIAAKLDMLSVPAWEEFLHQLKLNLIAKNSEHSGAIQALKNKLPLYTQEDYEAARSEIDQGYSSELEMQRYREKKLKEDEQATMARYRKSLEHPKPQRGQPREQVDHVA